jgi:hypothetical protein
MKKAHTRILAAMSVVMASSVASAQTPTSQAELVTVENYNRAQTDAYFAGVVKNGGFGKFRHGRELAPPAQQGIPRPNRDTLYSFAIADLDAGPVTITLPDAGKRYMGMQVVNQDQYTPGHSGQKRASLSALSGPSHARARAQAFPVRSRIRPPSGRASAPSSRGASAHLQARQDGHLVRVLQSAFSVSQSVIVGRGCVSCWRSCASEQLALEIRSCDRCEAHGIRAAP